MRRRVAIAVLAIAVLGIVSWLAVGTYRDLMRGKWQREKERALVGSLRTVCIQQGVFKRETEVDQDADEVGEFGWLNELCGACPLRRRDDGSQPASANPVYLSTAYCSHFFPDMDVACATRPSGSFVLFLPYPRRGGMDDRIVAEYFDFAKSPPLLDPAGHGNVIDLQEKHFVLYVIPVIYNAYHEKIMRESGVPSIHMSGRRRVPRRWDIPVKYTYAINEKGEVHYTKMEHRKYLWPESHVTDYRAAFVDDGTTDTVFNNPLADGQKGFDGNIWYKLKE